MTCPACGCAVHEQPQTYEVRCSVCKRPKWPLLAEDPGKDYVCALCRMGGARQAAARDRVKRDGRPGKRQAATREANSGPAPTGPGAA